MFIIIAFFFFSRFTYWQHSSHTNTFASECQRKSSNSVWNEWVDADLDRRRYLCEASMDRHVFAVSVCISLSWMLTLLFFGECQGRMAAVTPVPACDYF